MTLNETLKPLKTLGNEKTRAHNPKGGASNNQYGVKHGDILVLWRFFEARRSLQPARQVRSQ